MRVGCALFFAFAVSAFAGPFAPAAGQFGTTAIPHDSPLFVGWATSVAQLIRGPIDIFDPSGDLATHGSSLDVLGPSDALAGNNFPVLSLGDGGSITLGFSNPVTDGAGDDFAVFENGFGDMFLEFAFVEVSSDGAVFHRFDSFSESSTDTHAGAFQTIDPTDIHNLAGKYRAGFGTPFDLAELFGRPGLNIAAVTHVRLVDVVGTIDPAEATRDSLNRIIKDPFSTPFEAGGFDVDAVGVIHQAVPEPGSAVLLLTGSVLLFHRRRK